MRIAPLALVLSLAVAPLATVLADDGERCRAIAAPAERLACWDAL